MLIFLDFDGVLRRKKSPLYRLDADCLSTFEQAIRLLPETEIVITSAWREAFPLKLMRALFSADVAARIVGVTPIERQNEDHRRYREVLAYMKQRGNSDVPWIALDDDSSHYPPLSNLIVIDGERGFDSDAAGRLVGAALHSRDTTASHSTRPFLVDGVSADCHEVTSLGRTYVLDSVTSDGCQIWREKLPADCKEEGKVYARLCEARDKQSANRFHSEDFFWRDKGRRLQQLGLHEEAILCYDRFSADSSRTDSFQHRGLGEVKSQRGKKSVKHEEIAEWGITLVLVFATWAYLLTHFPGANRALVTLLPFLVGTIPYWFLHHNAFPKTRVRGFLFCGVAFGGPATWLILTHQELAALASVGLITWAGPIIVGAIVLYYVVRKAVRDAHR